MAEADRNNPLNLTYRPQDQWVGLAVPPNDGRYCRFVAPEYGFRAGYKQILKHIGRGNNTVRKLITAWAPESDHNPTAQYIANVCDWAILQPDEPLHLDAVGRMLMRAMARQETGVEYPLDLIQKGIDMATGNPVMSHFQNNSQVYGGLSFGTATTVLLNGILQRHFNITLAPDEQAALGFLMSAIGARFFPQAGSGPA